MRTPKTPRTSGSATHSAPAVALLGLLALLVLRGGSCVQIERPYKAPTAAQVVAAVTARGAQVRSTRAETRMSHRSGQGKIKATVRLMARRGGKLRFDAVTPFDTPLATLVSNGKQFGLLDAQKNRHYHGPASPCNIARLIGVVLNADDALTILGGSTPLIKHDKAELRWDERARAEVLTLRGPGGVVQTVRLDGTDRRWDLLGSVIKDGKGATVLSIKTGRFVKRGGLRVPSTIAVRQPKYKAELDVSFKKQELNLTLPAAAFELPAAGGLPSQRVECHTQVKR
jgi:hypothetical protein